SPFGFGLPRAAPARTVVVPRRRIVKVKVNVEATKLADRSQPGKDADRKPENWMDAILHDRTLRRGDVVTFPTGAKVFSGMRSDPPWTIADFEDVAGTDLLSKATKHTILALTGRIGSEQTERPMLAAAQTLALSKPPTVELRKRRR